MSNDDNDKSAEKEEIAFSNLNGVIHGPTEPDAAREPIPSREAGKGKS